MTKYASSSLRMLQPGMIVSETVGGVQMRQETVFVDGVGFHRFVVNPGLKNEFSTFYSTDSDKLRNAVVAKIKRTKS